MITDAATTAKQMPPSIKRRRALWDFAQGTDQSLRRFLRALP